MISVRPVRKKDAEPMLDLYNRHAQAYIGPVSRDLRRFRAIAGRKKDKDLCQVAFKGKKIVGYITGGFRKSRRLAWIGEVIVDPEEKPRPVVWAMTVRIYEALVKRKPAVIHAWGVSDRSLCMSLEKLGFFDAESTDVFMFGVLDERKFLNDLSPALLKRLERITGWEGVVRITCGTKAIAVEKKGDKTQIIRWTNIDPDMEVDINGTALARLTVGTDSLEDLVQRKEITLKSKLPRRRLKRILASLFPKKEFMIYDYW